MAYRRIWERSDQEREIEVARGVHMLELLCERKAEIGRDEMLELLEAANGREIHAQLSEHPDYVAHWRASTGPTEREAPP